MFVYIGDEYYDEDFDRFLVVISHHFSDYEVEEYEHAYNEDYIKSNNNLIMTKYELSHFKKIIEGINEL